jgi:hypothetical protein
VVLANHINLTPTGQQGDYMAKKKARKTARKSAKKTKAKRARARRSKKAAR